MTKRLPINKGSTRADLLKHQPNLAILTANCFKDKGSFDSKFLSFKKKYKKRHLWKPVCNQIQFC